ncbi:hypothetical protein PENANT_c017G07371 [Penicillium antarcticum]|uniref:Uncharacterized protein n=1 Tax=Penicillium antarcticum TaxID=416450 RepID=A0A1V6Q283_9EURO|nr:uncharacterized protein N7508_005362 [Penicillium antarcticum]KAJ5306347.1 hypothetical protein N7508_005362 [Penicillium antarcticum]OQD83398.1 hypothetical protein PENANT_c017G07371 [Penicillium antarcticum]
MAMESNGSIFDEAQYRQDVLHLSSPEAEQARAQQLADEARQLGVKIPETEATAPLSASIASGLLELSSPVLSSGSSTDRISVYDGSVTPSHEPGSPSTSALDQVALSLSEITIASENFKPGSTRSLASLSTRPTSFCSSEGRTGLAGHGYIDPFEGKSHRHSMLSVASADKKEKRRSSLKSAIGRIQFRKKRPSPPLVMSPDSQLAIPKGDKGMDHVYLESTPESSAPDDGPIPPAIPRPPKRTTEAALPRLRIPLFNKEALQRSLDDPELSELHKKHEMEKNRHLAFQETALNSLRRRHQDAVSEKRSDNERREEEKREKNIDDTIRLEERQLAVEIEQQREFDRAKMNSATRIKHMEGYFRNASPPPSPSITATTGGRSSGSFSDSASTPPARQFTRQHMEQLEQQYHDHESMDQLHDARIKVLRDRQDVKLQETMARLEKELNTMCKQHKQDITTIQQEQQAEEASLNQILDSKKTALRDRWHLEEAILRQTLEVRHGQLYGPLPPISFTNATSDIDTPVTITVPESSPLGASSTPDTIHPQDGVAP